MTWQLVNQAPMGPEITVRHHLLHNGLRLISARDPRAPIIAYQTWFSVGSANEKPGQTGMAHLFEHLMFNQTRNLELGEFDRRIESCGGDSNAATWVDWTYYQTSIPSKDLELIARLEAERMTDLVLEPEVVEAERDVVINERLQRVDDDVDGFASEELFRLAFQTHPYHWPTIGWMQDIKALSIPQIKEFYREFYAPDQATLVVVGDFEEEKLLSTIEKYYGSIPASKRQATAIVQEAKQCKERRQDFRKPVTSPRLLLGYKAPAQSHPDWPCLNFACHLLASSASSPLHRKLIVEKELLSTIYCDIMPFAHPSLIELGAVAVRDVDLDQILEEIDSLIASIIEEGVAESEIFKVRNFAETGFWGSLSTVDGKAESLGHYQCVHGDYRELFSMADSLAQVSAEDVRRVLRDYFRPEQRTQIRILPEDTQA